MCNLPHLVQQALGTWRLLPHPDDHAAAPLLHKPFETSAEMVHVRHSRLLLQQTPQLEIINCAPAISRSITIGHCTPTWFEKVWSEGCGTHCTRVDSQQLARSVQAQAWGVQRMHRLQHLQRQCADSDVLAGWKQGGSRLANAGLTEANASLPPTFKIQLCTTLGYAK